MNLGYHPAVRRQTTNGRLCNNEKSLKPPIGLGDHTKTADMDLYTTVLSSRPFLEQIITKFDLMKDYKLVSMEKAVKTLRKQIKGKVNDESA